MPTPANSQSKESAVKPALVVNGKSGSSRITAFLTTSPHRWWLFTLMLVAATITAYQPVWHAGFIWDDDKYVTENPLLTAPDGLWRIWFSLDSPSQYFPLTYTVFRFEWALWGLNPAGYHWVNILLHAANALLVWRLLHRLDVPGGWLAAAIFALHPVQVESVAWISELKSVLSLLFVLLALLAWTEFIKEGQGRGKFYLPALIFYALALCAKTTACTLPAALLLILWLKEKPVTRWRLLQVVPFVLLGLGMGLVTMWWERFHQGTHGKLFDLSLPDRMLIASHAVWFYAGKLVWPHDLTFSYPRWRINAADPLAYGWLLAGIIVLGMLFYARRRAGRSLEVATLFYLATLAPTLGFVMLYTFRYSFVADHYQYAACIGPFALIAAGVAGRLGLGARRDLSLVGCSARFMGLALCLVLLLTLGILTWRQCRMYSDKETLWRVTLARNPASLMAHNNLGILLLQNGETDEAIEQYRQAVSTDPDFAEAHNNLGNALLQNGQPDEAVTQCQQAVTIEPKYAQAHSNLGNALLQTGQVGAAITHYQTAIQLQPDNPFFLNNLAWVYATQPQARFRNGEEAVRLAEQACLLTDYREPQLVGTLATAYAEAGRFDEAVVTSGKAIELAQTLSRPKVARMNQDLLQLFKNHQPYRETVKGQ
jgi:Flp pilus assembly protein TadD